MRIILLSAKQFNISKISLCITRQVHFIASAQVADEERIERCSTKR